MHFVKNYIAVLDGQKQPKAAMIKPDVQKKLAPPAGQDARLYYKQRIDKFVNKDDCSIESVADMSLLLFELIE